MTENILIEDCTTAVADPRSPVRSILIEDGRITRLSADPSQPVAEGTARLDAAGGTVLPGLTDTHCHLIRLGESARTLDLRGTSNLTSIRLRLFASVQKAAKGEWIFGSGWDQERLSEGRSPQRGDIDDLTPENPVLLSRICSHVALLNSKAMEVLGVSESVTDPAGGRYGRDAEGRLTGVVMEASLKQVKDLLPLPTAQAVQRDIMVGEYEAARNGLTTVHSILSSNFAEELEAFAQLSSAGTLALRHRLYVPVEGMAYVQERHAREMFDCDVVRLQGVKVYTDGSLGASTAALREPYSDDPSNTGMLRYDEEELTELVRWADSAGYQVLTHAIGDRAIEQALGALASIGSSRQRRHRIEHASLMPREFVEEARSLGVCVSVQPHFVVSDSWAERRLGERTRDLYPFKTMVEAGLCLSAGSDAPVEPVNPILGIWSAIARRDDQALTMGEALNIYTSGGAYNGFDEESLGALREGAVGDLTVLDSDIGGMHPAMLRRVRVAATIVGGRVVFSQGGAG